MVVMFEVFRVVALVASVLFVLVVVDVARSRMVGAPSLLQEVRDGGVRRVGGLRELVAVRRVMFPRAR